MRKIGVAVSLIVTISAFAFFACRAPETIGASNVQGNPEPGIPENVHHILATSCFDCHTAESNNMKARSKLNFSKWDDMSKANKVSKLEKIQEVLKGGDMPPAKYLDKNPDKSPSAEAKQTVMNWAANESKKLVGE